MWPERKLKSILLQPGDHGDLQVHFHHLPQIERDAIILPAGVLERIEQQTVGFARLAERLLGQTEGVSAAFIRELLRKAALFAADEGEALIIEDRHLAEALHELVVEGGELTRRLLGAASGERTRSECG